MRLSRFVLPAALCLVRTFILFHDCSHGSFFSSRRANAWLGMGLGLLLYSPFLRWRHDHAVHHATSGDLGRRGVGDVRTLTVREYGALGRRGRLAYRLQRNPLLMFGLGPIIAMVIGPRIVATKWQDVFTTYKTSGYPYPWEDIELKEAAAAEK